MKSLLICAFSLFGFIQVAGQTIQPDQPFPVMGFLAVETGEQLGLGFTLEEGMGGVEKDWNYEWVILPEFPGGYGAFRNYLTEASVLSPNGSNVRGKESIYIRFRLDAEGYVSEVKIIRGLEEGSDITCLQAIYGLPKWEAAAYAGRKVPCWFALVLSQQEK